MTKLSIFVKLTHILLVIFTKFIFNQKVKRGFIWPKMLDFYVSNTFHFLFRKKQVFLGIRCSWIFYFSQIKVFIACHISKMYLQLGRKAWFYLAQNYRFFILKRLDFLFRKKCPLKILFLKFLFFLKTKCLLFAIFESEGKLWSYLVQHFCFFIWKTFGVLFRRSCPLKVAGPKFSRILLIF